MSKTDRALVEKVEAAVNVAGFTAWWDKRLPSGEDFGSTIVLILPKPVPWVHLGASVSQVSVGVWRRSQDERGGKAHTRGASRFCPSISAIQEARIAARSLTPA
jgi:hypothetical protein